MLFKVNIRNHPLSGVATPREIRQIPLNPLCHTKRCLPNNPRPETAWRNPYHSTGIGGARIRICLGSCLRGRRHDTQSLPGFTARHKRAIHRQQLILPRMKREDGVQQRPSSANGFLKHNAEGNH
ncbi:MAG: hypothetical protein ACRELF_30015, partial [Gemmataceae bacterium]